MERISRLAQPRRRVTRRSLLELLPVAHVAYFVLSFLDNASLATASATCREMHALASSDVLWRERVGGAGDPAGGALKDRYVRRRRELAAQRTAKLRETFARIQTRSGLETCLSLTIERLEINLTVTLNGSPCELLAFRRKSQQGRKDQFRVHSAAPAPNIAAGALRFDQAAVLKLAVPANLTEDGMLSLHVDCTSKLKSRGVTRVLSWDRSRGRRDASVSRLGQTGFSQIDLGRSSVLFGSLDPSASQQRGVALVVVNVHHLDVLAALGIAGGPHEPRVDDLDRNYGLHGYTGAFTIRSLGQTWWSQSFRELDSRSGDSNNRSDLVAFPVLDAEHCEGDVSRRIALKSRLDGSQGRPSLYFRTETFTGALEDHVVLDMTLWDEHREAFWAFSRVLPVSAVAADQAIAFDFDDGAHGDGFAVVHADPDKGRVHISVAPMHNRSTVVKELDLELSVNAIASWFGR